MKTNKKFTSVVTAFIAALLVLTGTFAWTSFSQQALNEKSGSNEAGGRIHDDYNKESGNKDIYAENYSTQNLITRIKLSEYLENNGTSLIVGAKKEDKKTWTPYTIGNTSATRDYVEWTLGGKKVYLPTFNKNSDDKSVDASGNAIDVIKNGVTAAGDGSQTAFTAGTDYTGLTGTEKHKAKDTLTEKNAPITMAAWKALSEADKKGDYWVIDTDGWAYWANQLAPGESTSLLLNQLDWKEGAIEGLGTWYYGIDVVGEFVSLVDKDKFPNSAYGAPSGDANVLIDRVVNKKVTYDMEFTEDVSKVTLTNGEKKEIGVKLIKTTEDGKKTEINPEKPILWTYSVKDNPADVEAGITAMKFRNSANDEMNLSTTIEVNPLIMDTRSFEIKATSKELKISKTFLITTKGLTYDIVLDLPENMVFGAGEVTPELGANLFQTSPDGQRREVELVKTTGDLGEDHILWWRGADFTAIEPENMGLNSKVTFQVPGGVTVTRTSEITVQFNIVNKEWSVNRNIIKKFNATVEPFNLKPGAKFDFFGERYIYLRTVGNQNRLVLKESLLENQVTGSIEYDGSELDKAMKNYYETLTKYAKSQVQPVQSIFDVGLSDLKMDQWNFRPLNVPYADQTILTEGGEKKAFALSAMEVAQTSGQPGGGVAFTSSLNRAATREDGTSDSWWLRSPKNDKDGDNPAAMWYINKSDDSGLAGKLFSDEITTTKLKGVRPALIIKR